MVEEFTEEEKLKIRQNIIEGKPSVADIYIKKSEVSKVLKEELTVENNGAIVVSHGYYKIVERLGL